MNNTVEPFSPELRDYFPDIFDPLQDESPTLAAILDPARSVEDAARSLTGDFQTHGPAMMEMIETLRHKASVIPPLFDKAYLHVYSELPNRQFFNETTTEELSRFNRRESQGSTVILMDVDKLKAVNDRYSHATGDDFLKQAATHIRDQIREHADIPDNNVVAHFGGDEFAILITNETEETANKVAEQLKASLDGLAFGAPDGVQIPISLSMGVVHAQKGEDFSDVMARADDTLKLDKDARPTDP